MKFPLLRQVVSRLLARSLCHGLAAVMGVGVAAGAVATAPEADELVRLQATLSSAQVVRVTGSFGTQRLRDVRLDSTGVISARWGPGAPPRAALFVGQDVAPPPRPRPMAWDEISRIETGRTQVGRTARNTAIVGALLGEAVWLTIPTGDDGGAGPASVVIGVPAASGFLLGALLGARSYEWSPVYPRGTLTAR
jgi:hypothetical protein